MKKILYYSIMAAILCGVALSCAKEDPAPVNEQVPEDTNTPVTGTNVWSFSASIENPGTKVTSELSGDKFVFNWEASVDVVKVIWDGGSTTGAVESVTEGTATFSFTELPADGTHIWLVYPSTLEASLEDGNLKIAMPEALKSDNHACYLVAKANVGDALVNFKHPVSYYRMTVDRDSADITKLTMSVTSGNITATHLTIAFDRSNEISTITPVSGTGSVDVTMNGIGTYYIPVVPDLALNRDSNPLLFKFFRGEAPAGGVYYKSTVTFGRAATVNFGNLPTTATNRYVSTSGTGRDNGTSWKKAWNATQFASFLKGEMVSGDKLAAMNGLTIHLAAGDEIVMPGYDPDGGVVINLGSDVTSLTIDGGTGATLKGDGSHPILGQNNTNRNSTTVTFKNITFYGGKRAGDKGGAVYQSTGTLVYKGCTFHTNSVTGSHGGALHFYGGSGALATAVFDDCSFYNNSAAWNGGVMNIESTANDGYPNVTFNRCSFVKNTASGSLGGGVVYSVSTKATVNFNGCVFGDGGSTNKNSAASGYGGVLYTNAAAGSFNMTGCQFKCNEAAHAGGAVCVAGTASVNLSECVFDGNYASGTTSDTDGGGAINVGGTKSKIYLNKCLFKDNYGFVGGALTNYSNGGEIYMNACAFTGNYITGTYGVVIALRGGADVKASLFMNNVTMADNQYTKSKATGQQSCWINLNGLTKFVLSNSSLIGRPRNAEGTADDANPNLLRFDGKKGSSSNYHWLINNIIAITADSGTLYSCDLQNSYVKSYNNKLSALLNSTNFSKDGNGTGINFWGNTTSFEELAYSNPVTPTWNNCYWSRKGGSDTTGTDGNVDKQKLENVNVKINTADSGFHTWLNSIGALNQDGRGHARSDWSWPGAYNN